MKKIIIVSRCLKTFKNLPQIAEFSFKGYYSGYHIKSLIISHSTQMWEQNEEYVIYLQIEEMKKNKIWGKALKFKKLSEFMMRN